MSNFAGTAIVPTLSRIVLALAFTTVGYNKLFTEKTDFTAEQANILRGHGVQITPTSGGVVRAENAWQIVPASFPQDEEAGQEPPAEITQLPEPPDEGQAGDAQGPAPLPEGDYTAKQMYSVTLMCSEAGWPRPYIAAWVLALTEFVGGALLLVGFLSRIWGLGLAIAMGAAFYLVAIGKLGVLSANPFTFAQDIGAYQTVVVQLGLFVLAFGIFLTGAGPLSLDRLLFGARGGRKESAVVSGDDVVIGQDSSANRPV